GLGQGLRLAGDGGFLAETLEVVVESFFIDDAALLAQVEQLVDRCWRCHRRSSRAPPARDGGTGRGRGFPFAWFGAGAAGAGRGGGGGGGGGGGRGGGRGRRGGGRARGRRGGFFSNKSTCSTRWHFSGGARPGGRRGPPRGSGGGGRQARRPPPGRPASVGDA